MSITAVSGLSAYQNALADFSKTQKSMQSTAASIAKTSTENTVASFSDTLNNSLASVNDLQAQKGAMVQSFVSGETQNVHELMITMQKASLAVNLTSAVRNKVLEAYRELSKLQF